MVSTRLASVAIEIRPGIHPSQNSTASRAERGVAPQYQNGTRPPTGLGSIVTSWKEKMSSLYVTSFSVKTFSRILAFDRTISTRSRSPQPMASNSWSKVPAPKPRIRRGPTSWVIVPAIRAVTSGWRNGISDPVPSSIRSVTAPMAVRVVSAS